MCGRFTLFVDAARLQQAFGLDRVPDDVPKRYNIAPTQQAPVVANDDPAALAFYRWGLIPFWAKDPAIGNRLINARAETAADKPSFRDAFKKRRCLIPTSGFYEWRTAADGGKQPVFIRVDDAEVFAFAGLWERWNDPQGAEVRTFTILTTDANDALAEVHHRMPVIVARDDYDVWLSADDLAVVQGLLRPYTEQPMSHYPVSREVNKPTHDDASLVQPLAG